MKKIFISRIKKYFPIELLLKIEEISQAHDIDNNEKTIEVRELLKEYNIPYSPLGKGTNRYGILLDGFAFKIALDRAGKIDNQREFKYGKMLYPYVIKVYECLDGGLIASFEYVSIFTLDVFYKKQAEMREILEELSRDFLIGDIGVTTQNYVNWGSRVDGSICILDFAYIYSLSYKGFKCTCDAGALLEFDRDYNNLVCPVCHHKFSFDTIRRRISRKDEIEEIGDIKKVGYVMEKEEEIHELDPEKSDYVKKKKKKKKTRDIPGKEKASKDYNEPNVRYSATEVNDILSKYS